MIDKEKSARLRVLLEGAEALHDAIEMLEGMPDEECDAGDASVTIGSDESEAEYAVNEKWEADILLPALRAIEAGLVERIQKAKIV